MHYNPIPLVLNSYGAEKNVLTPFIEFIEYWEIHSPRNITKLHGIYVT